MPIKAALTIGAKGAGKAAKATDQEALVEAAKAADRAAAGRRAADVAKATEPMKLSEALGNLNVEGKGKLKVTQSDRTRVGGGNIGGAMFSGLQQVDPFYEGLVWGVGEKGTASKMIGQSDPFTFWSTILGAEDQLKSNPLVFNKLRKGFTDAMKEGKLTKELEKKINHNLALTFGEGAEIRDPKIWQKADTFEKRAALADIMLGKGIPPSKGGVALGGEKSGKGVIFRPTDILKQETEPLLLHPEHGGDVPTFAVGPRLFNLEGNVVYRPDLHPGFPYLLTGEDTGMVFKPGEAEKIMRDYAQRLKDQGKARIGYYEWTLGEKGKGLPTQDINEEYLTYLQKQGMAEGGLASPEGIPPVVSDLEAQYQAYKAGGPVHMQDGGNPGSISATPQNALLGALAKALKFREEAQKGLNSPTGTLLDLILPTSETVEKLSYGDPLFRMPQQSNIPITTDKPYVAETLSMVPFAPPVARGAARGAESVGTAATRAITGKPDLTAEQIYKAMGDTEAITKLGAPAIVKPKGGNWLAGQVEKKTEPIREKLAGGTDPAAALVEMEKALARPELSGDIRTQFEVSTENLKPMVAINKWIDQKLNRYIKNEMGTPEDPLRLGADDWAQKQQKLLADKDAEIQRATDKMEEVARQRGVTPEMLTQSRQDLLKLQKERDFIANRTGLHFSPQETQLMSALEQRRIAAGFPKKATASSEIGRLWEDTADKYVGYGSKAGEIIQPNYYLREGDAKRVYSENPWLFKVPPETRVNMVNTGMDEYTTGFQHMVDELKNALNPNSGLPENLLIKPKDLEKMTVQQAADLVDRINAYRSVQKAEANALSAQKSVEVVKEYPETEKGLRWVEMKMLPYPEKLPEGFEVVNQAPRAMSVRKIGDDGRGALITGTDLKDVIEGIYKHYPDTPGNPRKALEEALRYEGDVMQHCVGGYCPDVVSGQSRIFSLRDKAGKPAVTIEVTPNPQPYPVSGEDFAKLDGETKAQYREYVRQWRQRHPDVEELTDEHTAMALAEAGVPPRPPLISQIKGPKNQRPDDEFIPFVQDFIKSQQWSHIGDLSNADLVWLRPNILKNAQDRGIDVNIIAEFNGEPVISKDEFNRLADLFGGINKYKKKSGGPVNFEEQFRAYKAGGPVHMQAGGTPITDEISGMLPALDPNQESSGSPTFEATKFIASQIPKALVSPFVGAYKTITSGKFGTQEGIKAGEKAMEEFMLPSGDLSPAAAEKVGQFGKFMEELETKYKLPPLMPEVFGPVTGSLTGMAPQLRSIAGKAGTAVKEAVSEVPPLPVGLSIEPVGKPITEVLKTEVKTGKPAEIKAPANELGLFSQAEKAALNLQRKQGTGDAFLNDLKRGGVSNEELEFSGLQSFLSGQAKVTKEDIQEFTEANKYKFSEIQYEAAKGDQAEMKFRGDSIDDPDYISSNADDIFNDFDNYNPGRRDEIAQRIYDEYTPEELANPAIKADIDSKIDDNIRQEAYDIAYSQYWESPYYRYENDLGYEILGNDDVGFTVRDARGRPVGDYFRTQEEAEGAANTHAIDMGLVSEGQTLYHDYQLPLGENYREIWIQYQPQPNPALTKREQAQLEGLYEKFRKSIGPDKDRPVMTPEDTVNFNRLKTKAKLANERDEYNDNPHIEEPDVIAHLRLQDRITTDGKPMLYVDELQSDWHQQGADRGYRTPENMANADEIRSNYLEKQSLAREAQGNVNQYKNQKEIEFLQKLGKRYLSGDIVGQIGQDPEFQKLRQIADQALKEYDEAKKPYEKLNELLPNAPLKETWHKLGLKRALNYAARNGYDRVGFSAASPQIKRWGTQEIAWEKTEDGWNVSATEQKGGLAGRMNLEAEARARGILKERKSVPIKTQAELRELVESIGRRLSENQIDRITKKTWDRMQKFDTGVSAPREEGMLAFYDNKLKKALQDYAKQMGGRFYETKTKVGRGVTEEGGYADLTEPVYMIEFTPELKKSALKGQPYKKGGAVKMQRGGPIIAPFNTVPDVTDAGNLINFSLQQELKRYA
jgi:hypothetical protein